MKPPTYMVDRDFEFFLEKGKLLVHHNGTTKSFETMSSKLRDFLFDVLARDPDANLCLDCMDLSDPVERLRQFVLCRFSSFDLVADITEGGHMNPEFTLCDKRGKCPYEGTLCRSLAEKCKLSSREIEVVRFINQDLPNKMIAEEMGISVNTVSTHVQSIQAKTGVHSKYGILSWAYKYGIIDDMPAELVEISDVKFKCNF